MQARLRLDRRNAEGALQQWQRVGYPTLRAIQRRKLLDPHPIRRRVAQQLFEASLCAGTVIGRARGEPRVDRDAEQRGRRTLEREIAEYLDGAEQIGSAEQRARDSLAQRDVVGVEAQGETQRSERARWLAGEREDPGQPE